MGLNLFGGGGTQAGLLGGMGAPQAPSRLGLFGSILQDAGASLDGHPENATKLQAYSQMMRQSQLLQAINSPDPAVRQQAYVAARSLGIDTSSFEKSQAGAAMPKLLSNMQPQFNPVQATPQVPLGSPPGMLPNGQQNPGSVVAQRTAAGDYSRPDMSAPSLQDALSATGNPELSAQMGPEIIKQALAQQAKVNEPFNLSDGQHHFVDGKDVASLPEKQNFNAAFNTDGTPNTRFQDYEIRKARETALARQQAANPTISGNAPGTIGAPQIDVTPEGYSRAIIPNSGGLTQSAIDQAALDLAITGKFPSGMGVGSTGAGGQRKTAIQNRSGELNAGGNIAANGAQLKALTSSLTQQTNYANATERSVANAENGYKQVVSAFMGKVNNSQLPIINAMSNAAKYQLAPGDVSAFRAGLTEVANEYSNVFSRGGIVTDAVRAQAKQIADGNLSITDLNKVFSELQAQGNIVIDGSKSQVQHIQGQLNGIISGAAPAPSPTKAAAPSPANLPRTMPKGGTTKSGVKFQIIGQ